MAKASIKHPYAAIEHRVIDSPAYADLSHSACRLLTLIARQLTVNLVWSKGNNGHLHAAFSWCKPYGIGSEHTLRKAIAELISHGFIYRTRSHGANKVCARYAVTWLPIKDTKDLFLAGFVPCAWRDWAAPGEKSTRQKVQELTGKKCSFTPLLPAKNAGCTVAGSADNELVPILSTNSGGLAQTLEKKTRTHPLAIKLKSTLDRGTSRIAH
ncbi:hypothetical protein [Sideroxydans sp. CL21]|uniref:hypothetical protein n=1 Tax=Sideroxydans sp. CL21 TaxID=2600596 RepID=UPI0024BBFCB2|nr:hypothetical protein [Sideroxydans sp. CL21]